MEERHREWFVVHVPSERTVSSAQTKHDPSAAQPVHPLGSQTSQTPLVIPSVERHPSLPMVSLKSMESRPSAM